MKLTKGLSIKKWTNLQQLTDEEDILVTTMTSKAVRYLVIAQLSLFGFLFVCFLLLPTFLLRSNEGGVSNYGVHFLTVIPYTLAFGLCSIYTYLAARELPANSSTHTNLRRVLLCLSVLFFVLLLTTYPYKLNQMWNNIHIYAGVVLMVYEIAVGIWLAAFVAQGYLTILILLVQLVGFILAAFTFYGVGHHLFIAESVASLAFSVLLIRSAMMIKKIPTHNA